MINRLITYVSALVLIFLHFELFITLPLPLPLTRLLQQSNQQNISNSSNSTNVTLLNPCSVNNDCYNCSMYLPVNCEWINDSCAESNSFSISLYFYKTFTKCLSSSLSLNEMQYYCGPLTRTIPFTTTPVKVGSEYFTKNMYCMITAINLDPSQIINVTLSIQNQNTYDQYALQISYLSGSTENVAINTNQYNKLYSGVQSINFHYYAYQVSFNSPYILSLNYANLNSNSYLVLIIAIGAVVIVCIGCSIFFWKCSKSIMEKNRQRMEQQLRQQSLLVSNQQPSSVQLAQLEAEKKRNKLKNALKLLFETDLKPKKYLEEENEFHTDCTICLEDFTDLSVVVTLICKHVYHFECIKDWIKKQKGDFKCPNCNNKIIPDKYLEESIENIDIGNLSPLRPRPNNEILVLNNNNNNNVNQEINNLLPLSNNNNNFISNDDRRAMNNLNVLNVIPLTNTLPSNSTRVNLNLQPNNQGLQNNIEQTNIEVTDLTPNRTDINRSTIQNRRNIEGRVLNINTGAYRLN